jgi:hypothetical protein
MAMLPDKELALGATTLELLAPEDWFLVLRLALQGEVSEAHTREGHHRGTRCPILGIKEYYKLQV